MYLKGLFRLGWLMLASLLMTPAIAQQRPAPAPAVAGVPGESLADGYVLGSGDVVEVSVLGREDFRSRVQIQFDGTIELPLIGNIGAGNKTVLQLKEEIRSKLKNGGFFSNPAVNISIATYASRYVVVLGEVGAPGIVPIDRAYRVSEILARVGGAKGSGADILTITRATGEEVKLDVRQISTGSGDADPFVNAGDKIFVPAAPTFYVYGQVNSPGAYRIDANMTVRMALARSGGLTALGSAKRIKVTREGKDLKMKLDDPIGDKDVIVVGQRFF